MEFVVVSVAAFIVAGLVLYSGFGLGTLLMPPAKRRAIWAIYVWCRRTDELMDSPEAQALPVAELSARLDAWEQRTRERRPDLFARWQTATMDAPLDPGMELRIGNGHDIHRLVPGRALILGGVTLDHPDGLGLDGHSDADVLVHAVIIQCLFTNI